MTKNRVLVTAALIYANGPIHIGHLAGCYIPADVFVRYLRLKEKDVLFVSGTDEHGVPITIKAKKEGISPQEVVDKYYKSIKKSFEDFGINFDIYSRTSHTIHHEVSQEFFKNLYEKNVFLEKTTEQYFDPIENKFLADRYIVGTCPKCGFENAYGDQCEKCGSTLSPMELINPRSMMSGASPILKETKNWYLPLDEYAQKLENYLSKHPEWKPNVIGQCQSWLKQGLQPRAMTRDLDWGVKVPLPDTDGKVLYVWFDAPIGYITFTQELLKNQRDWKEFWKDENTSLVHFIGKDNIVFHCLIFPTMLMAHGEGYILPENVPAFEFMNLEGEKISTSRNWAVWLHEFLEEFVDSQDVLRYVLIANGPENKDSDFTWTDFQARNNNELVANFGNFVNRTVVLTHKYFQGKIPKAVLIPQDLDLLKQLDDLISTIDSSLENYKFRDALEVFMNISRLGNKYLADTEPWKLTDMERIGTVLRVCLEIMARISIVGEPFLPFTTQKLQNLLQTKGKKWAELINQKEILHDFQVIEKIGLLFAKIEDETIQKQIQKLENTKKMNQPPHTAKPIKPEITYEDFDKIDLRIGTVIACEKVPKADKLLQLTVEIGTDRRTIVSGIAQHYTPEQMVGKQICVVANLAPRTLRGIESKGMLLTSEGIDNQLFLLTSENEVLAGSVVK